MLPFYVAVNPVTFSFQLLTYYRINRVCRKFCFIVAKRSPESIKSVLSNCVKKKNDLTTLAKVYETIYHLM